MDEWVWWVGVILASALMLRDRQEGLDDIDGDGDLDAAFANDGDPQTVFLNN